jgi:hypothetical protein
MESQKLISAFELLKFMDIFHLMHCNLTHRILGTASVSLFRLAFPKQIVTSRNVLCWISVQRKRSMKLMCADVIHHEADVSRCHTLWSWCAQMSYTMKLMCADVIHYEADVCRCHTPWSWCVQMSYTMKLMCADVIHYEADVCRCHTQWSWCVQMSYTIVRTLLSWQPATDPYSGLVCQSTTLPCTNFSLRTFGFFTKILYAFPIDAVRHTYFIVLDSITIICNNLWRNQSYFIPSSPKYFLRLRSPYSPQNPVFRKPKPMFSFNSWYQTYNIWL